MLADVHYIQNNEQGVHISGYFEHIYIEYIHNTRSHRSGDHNQHAEMSLLQIYLDFESSRDHIAN